MIGHWIVWLLRRLFRPLGISVFKEGERESALRYGKFIAHPTVPRLWRRCACGIRTAAKIAPSRQELLDRGESPEYAGKRKRPAYYIGSIRVPLVLWNALYMQAWARKAHERQDSHRGDCPAQGWYLGVLSKGWWHFFPGWKRGGFRHCEIEFAVGGEDNMIGLTLWLPFLFYGALGFRLPRRLTKKVVYSRREWGVSLTYGPRIRFRFAYDEEAKNMKGYYARQTREQGHCSVCRRTLQHHEGDGSMDKAGSQVVGPHEFVLWRPPRASMWKGIEIEVRLLRVRDLIFGKKAHTNTVLYEPTVETIPLPEGNYYGKFTLSETRWRRPRAWWDSNRWVGYSVEFCDALGNEKRVHPETGHEVGLYIPRPGKNHRDSGIYGMTSGLPRANIALAIGDVTQHVLKERERLGGKNWRRYEPEHGWPDFMVAR